MLQTLIACVGPTVCVGTQPKRLLIQQGLIVHTTRCPSEAQNHSTSGFNQQLCLESMVFFLATVVAALFFLGRSMGVSVASISTRPRACPQLSQMTVEAR